MSISWTIIRPIEYITRHKREYSPRGISTLKTLLEVLEFIFSTTKLTESIIATLDSKQKEWQIVYLVNTEIGLPDFLPERPGCEHQMAYKIYCPRAKDNRQTLRGLQIVFRKEVGTNNYSRKMHDVIYYLEHVNMVGKIES